MEVRVLASANLRHGPLRYNFGPIRLFSIQRNGILSVFICTTTPDQCHFRDDNQLGCAAETAVSSKQAEETE